MGYDFSFENTTIAVGIRQSEFSLTVPEWVILTRHGFSVIWYLADIYNPNSEQMRTCTCRQPFLYQMLFKRCVFSHRGFSKQIDFQCATFNFAEIVIDIPRHGAIKIVSS